MSEHRMPPHSMEAEMSVLGAIFLEPDVLPTVRGLLQSADFYRDVHRRLYGVMLELVAGGNPVDLVTVTEALQRGNSLDAVGGVAYLAKLVDYVPTAANVVYYCNIVRGRAVARRLIQAATVIAETAYSDADADGMVASALKAVEEVSTSGTSGSDRALLTLGQMADLYERHVRSLDKTRFATGFSDLDGIIRGVAPGEVMMITAYSGLFKSALLQNMLLDACRRTEEHHLFFSLEMPATRVFERTVQISLEEYTYRVESGFHHHSDYRERAMTDLVSRHADKLIVCEQPAITIEQVEHYSRMARARFGTLGAIGIDYLGLMAAEGKDKEYDRISYVAENSKNLAKRLNVPVIILCQINRNAAREGDVEKHSAKGSGAVEASADYMLALQRNDRKDLILKILKNRNGEENLSFLVDIDAKYLKFRGLTPCDSIAAKNSDRGRSRVRSGLRNNPVHVDPF